MTRCKYCQAPSGDHGHPSAYNDVLACRDRMLDRERRVVRVFWRVRHDDGRVNPATMFWTIGQARSYARAWACNEPRVFKVTVRRKVKP